MTKHETMTEKLSREILQQNSQYRNNESEMISPVPYGASPMESTVSGAFKNTNEESKLSSQQPIQAFNSQFSSEINALN